MRRAVGFDLGETLFTYAATPLNWASLYRSALTRVADECGQSPDATAFECAEQILSRHNTRLHPRTAEVTAEAIFQAILKCWNVNDGDRLHPAIAAFFRFFQHRLVAYPESADTLISLKKAGFRLGALTDVPYGMPRAFVERDLRAVNLEPQLDVLLTSVDVGFRKPAAIGFRLLARNLGVADDDLWFVGNEEKDIAGSLAAGATAVLIDRENLRPQWGQHHTIRTLSELGVLLTN